MPLSWDVIELRCVQAGQPRFSAPSPPLLQYILQWTRGGKNLALVVFPQTKTNVQPGSILFKERVFTICSLIGPVGYHIWCWENRWKKLFGPKTVQKMQFGVKRKKIKCKTVALTIWWCLPNPVGPLNCFRPETTHFKTFRFLSSEFFKGTFANV